MVARKHGAESGVLGSLLHAFELWRMWLSRIAWTFTRSVRELRLRPESRPSETTSAARTEVDASDHVEHADTSAWLIAAVAAIALGGIARLALAPGGAPRLEALSAVGLSWLLAAIRLLVLAATLGRDGFAPRIANEAWARGALVWAMAADPALTAVAWAVSAFVTARALVNRGVPLATARRAVLRAWGTHALVVIGVWLLTNAWVANLAR